MKTRPAECCANCWHYSLGGSDAWLSEKEECKLEEGCYTHPSDTCDAFKPYP
jgi:hypothetical protein